MQQRSLLGIFAHPDDEAFGSGGTLARYARDGVAVTLVCATRGEVGEISDQALATPATLGRVREGEMRCAATALGVQEVVFLEYRDSGMAGTPANQDPRAFIQVPAEVVVPLLVGIIRRCKPQVVITFDPRGGYGHPDHIAVHQHTVAAFHAAGDATRYPDQGVPWQPSRLFYSVFPRGMFREMHQRMREAGVDTSQWERFEESGIGWPDEQVDIQLGVSQTFDAKWAAFGCHATQFGPDNPFRKIPEAAVRQMMSREFFALAWPQTSQAGLVDLFGGLP